MSISEKLKRYVALDETKRKLKAEQELVEAEMVQLKSDIEDFYVETGCSSMKIDGKTVYTSRTIWAGNADEVSSETVTKALIDLGQSHMITYNRQSISAWVRELAREHGLANKDGVVTATTDAIQEILPDELKVLVKVTDKYDLKVRKG